MCGTAGGTPKKGVVLEVEGGGDETVMMMVVRQLSLLWLSCGLEPVRKVLECVRVCGSLCSCTDYGAYRPDEGGQDYDIINQL